MDTLFSLKVFRQVVQSGSFTRAADQLDISTAMASKHAAIWKTPLKPSSYTETAATSI